MLEGSKEAPAREKERCGKKIIDTADNDDDDEGKKNVDKNKKSHLDTVPVTLSPLCGANDVASRSSSNLL